MFTFDGALRAKNKGKCMTAHTKKRNNAVINNKNKTIKETERLNKIAWKSSQHYGTSAKGWDEKVVA